MANLTPNQSAIELTNISSPSSTDYVQYLEDYAGIYMPYLILNFCGIVLGTIGNLIILITIGLDKSLNKNPAYMLMFNLSLSDIGISIFVDGFTNVGN